MLVQALNITVDASNVPQRYSITVLEICKLYPRQLIFFFKAELTATSFMQREKLPAIVTYFTVNCTNTAAFVAMPPHSPPTPPQLLEGGNTMSQLPHLLEGRETSP